MDGTNSAGRKISLLNDQEPPHLTRLPSFAPSLGSRASSYTTSNYATSSIGSPPTPQLIRSNSSDSMDNQTPSPITPDFAIDNGLGSPQFSQPGFFNTRHHQQQQPQPAPKDMEPAFPIMSMPYHAAQPHAAYYAPPPAQAPAQSASAQAAAAAKARPKKNQYPCPLAKQENCHDFFTTSGHAARHSKKHTGRKDAICPECNKAFTRKDNMEQHRRTHKGGRGSSKAASDRGAKKATARAQRPKLSPTQTQTSTPVLSPTALDPSLPISPTGSSFMGQAPQSAFMQPAHMADQFIDFAQRGYPDPTAYALTSYNYPPPPSNDHAGLDVLATAASDTRRFS